MSEAESFKPSTPNYPLPGDVVMSWGFNDCLIHEDTYGVLDGMEGVPRETYVVTFNNSTFWGRVSDETRETLKHGGPICSSGGPGIFIDGCILEYTGGTKEQRFWRWKDGFAGKDRGEDYTKTVRIFKLKEKRK